MYRSLASSRDRHVRAAALMRLARSLREQQQLQEALAVYGELAALGETPVAGSPAELLARRERIELFQTIGDRESAKHDMESLASALSEGRYHRPRDVRFFQGICTWTTGTGAEIGRRRGGIVAAVSATACG